MSAYASIWRIAARQGDRHKERRKPIRLCGSSQSMVLEETATCTFGMG